MPRPRKAVPEYEHHKPSGRAYVRMPTPGGGRRVVYLGKHGSTESRQAYARIVEEIEAGATQEDRKPGTGITVNRLLVRYLAYAANHYRGQDGKPTSELEEMHRSLTPLAELYGETSVNDFGPLALKAVRGALLKSESRVNPHSETDTRTRKLSRGVINKRISRIRRVFKWGVAEELVPPMVHAALTALQGLQRGRTTAHETKAIGPVDPSHVKMVKAKVLPEVRAMIEVQELAAMRPQDVCGLKPSEIDRSGKVWIYRPGSHKTAWRGKVREVQIGPKAQKVLKPFLEGIGDNEFVFSPRRAIAAKWARMRAARKTSVQPSQANRNQAMRLKSLGESYTTQAYGHAIIKACRRLEIPPWGPNRLRHTAATNIRKKYGVEAAQAALGHDRLNTTEIYAEKNRDLAAKVAKEMG